MVGGTVSLQVELLIAFTAQVVMIQSMDSACSTSFKAITNINFGRSAYMSFFTMSWIT